MGYKKKLNEKSRGHGNGSLRRGRGSSSTATTVSAAAPPVRPLEINEETRWKPRSLLASEENESSETHDSRLVLLLLNKLTPQNFDKVATVFLSQTTIHESNERMKHAIDEIVKRASLDMRYAQVYARLCKSLASDLPKGIGDSCVSFREALLQFCRDITINPPSFDRSPHEEDSLFEHPEEREVRLTLARHLNVGSKRFVGELYNCGVFQLSVMLSFVEMLLNQTEIQPTTTEEGANEIMLEGLCVLLDACGKSLDETAIETPEMQRCWKVLGETVACEDETERPCRTLSSRMKCIVLDLLELRGSGWCPVRYSSRQRKEMVAKPLECDVELEAGNSSRKSRRGGKRKGKTVRFATK